MASLNGGGAGANMEKPAQNIQDSFLNTARKEKAQVTIYLVSGVKLCGRIKSFDKYSLILENNSQEQLIFKHAISTVVTARCQAPSTAAAGTASPATGPTTQSQSQPPAPSHAELAEG
jgi:host factor-I protein